MNDTDKKEDSWIHKLPKIIAFLVVLIFIIIVIRDHTQYKKWKEDQSNLTGKVKQTSEELALLREANGSLQDITKKVGTLEQRAVDMTAAQKKLIEEKNKTEITLSKLRQDLKDLNGQVSNNRKEVTELMKKSKTLNNTNQELRDDILNKKNVLHSIGFLQRQIPVLEQNIQDLKTRQDSAAKTGLEQQAKLEALQDEIKEGEAAIQVQNERRAALTGELTELTETVKKLSTQKDKLENWDDYQKKLEYFEYLEQQKDTLETSINNLLEKGKKMEESNLDLQQKAPAR
jgi:predicted  nucleic acid-binding Zn-ribbon protein